MADKDKKFSGIKKDSLSNREILSSLYTMLAPETEEEEDTKAKNRFNGSTGTLYSSPDDLENEKNNFNETALL